METYHGRNKNSAVTGAGLVHAPTLCDSCKRGNQRACVVVHWLRRRLVSINDRVQEWLNGVSDAVEGRPTCGNNVAEENGEKEQVF